MTQNVVDLNAFFPRNTPLSPNGPQATKTPILGTFCSNPCFTPSEDANADSGVAAGSGVTPEQMISLLMERILLGAPSRDDGLAQIITTLLWLAKRCEADRGEIAALLAFVKEQHLACCCSLWPDTLACIPTENRLKRGLHALRCGHPLSIALNEVKTQFVDVAP